MSPPLHSQRGADPTRVTAGYGAGGGYAFEFFLPDGQLSDTGFLKLFVSTNYVDLDWMAQLSPFDHHYQVRFGRRGMPDTGIWDTSVAAVTVYEDGAAHG